jgi:hypothetical protein
MLRLVLLFTVVATVFVVCWDRHGRCGPRHYRLVSNENKDKKLVVIRATGHGIHDLIGGH